MSLKYSIAFKYQNLRYHHILNYTNWYLVYIVFPFFFFESVRSFLLESVEMNMNRNITHSLILGKIVFWCLELK